MCLERIHSLITCHVNQYGPSYNRKNRGSIRLSNTPIATPVRFLKSIVPMIVISCGDVSQAVNLCRHIIADKECATVPSQPSRISLGQSECQVPLSLDSLRKAKGQNLSQKMPKPLVGSSVIVDPKIVYLALFDQAQCLDNALRRQGI